MTAQKYRTVVLGNFDGLHIGHQQLIQLGRAIADEQQEELAVFTFYPQMQAMFDADFCYLLPETEKLAHLRQLRVDVVETVPFAEQVARLSPEAFVQTILVEKMRARHVVVGFNYSFGYRGAGSPDLLRKLGAQYGIGVTVMEPCRINDEVVSSTAIRQYLKEGAVEKANQMLGYAYAIAGPVCHGNEIGRTIGFPTANISVEPHILLPANGVYAALTTVDGKVYPSILNIGLRPTIEKSVGLTVEVNLLDFHADIYGKEIRTELHAFLRPEQKFSGLDGLKAQLQRDEARAREFFAAYEKK